MSVALGSGVSGALPKQKDGVTVIGVVKITEGGYTLTVEAVKRGDAVIIGSPKPAEKK